MIYLNFATLSFLSMGYSALQPLFYSTSIPLGGVGLDPYMIGIIMGSFGCANAILQARFLGPSIRRFGARKLYILSFPGLFAGVALFPIIKYFAQRFGRVNYPVVVCMIVQLSFRMLSSTTFGILPAFMLVQVTSSNYLSRRFRGSYLGTACICKWTYWHGYERCSDV